jgi:hypothetical protein
VVRLRLSLEPVSSGLGSPVLQYEMSAIRK